MNPLAAVLAILSICSAPAQRATLDPLVPWRGIKNTVTPSHDEQVLSRNNLLFCAGTVDPFQCFLPLPPEIPNFKAITAPPTKSTAIPSSPDKTWTEAVARHPQGAIESRGIIQRIDGLAEYSTTKGQGWTRTRVGQRIDKDSAVRTAPGATIDLTIFENNTLIRLMPETKIRFEALNSRGRGQQKTFDTLIDLQQGSIQTRSVTNSPPKTYLIRTTAALLRIKDAAFEAHANGACIIAEGSAEVITPTQIHTVNPCEKYAPTLRP